MTPDEKIIRDALDLIHGDPHHCQQARFASSALDRIVAELAALKAKDKP